MAVVSVVSVRIKPGRRDDFIAGVREVKTVIEPLGVNLRSIRLFEAVLAGPDTGVARLSFEYDDLASWGATVEREAQDARFNALLAQRSGPDNAATSMGRSLLAEIAPGATASGGATHGPVRQVVVGQVKPGRMDEYVSRMADVNPHVLRSGALNIRHLAAVVAGANTGRVFGISEYADMAAFATAWQRNDEPEWQALVESIAGADGPVEVLAQSIAIEVPL